MTKGNNTKIARFVFDFTKVPKYNTSWDLLIPIVLSIKNIGVVYDDLGYEHIEEIDKQLLRCNLEGVYNGIISFINSRLKLENE